MEYTPDKKVSERYFEDPEHRNTMLEQGWTDDTIHERDTLAEALEAFDDVKEERMRAQAMVSSRETTAQPSKGKQEGLKGGWMGMGMRPDEDVARAGRWRITKVPEDVPDPQMRLATEEQWARARRYQHHAIYQMPSEEESEESSSGGWQPWQQWSSRGAGSWQSWHWWS